jgi:parvulin-like peptidyl-prolyl isomerase
MQRADRAGIKVPDETLNNALNDVATQNHIKLTDLPDALAAQGIDYAGYRDTLRKELAMQILRQRDVIGRINVSPREIEQFLERQKKMPSESQPVRRLAHPDRRAAGRDARGARRSRQEGRRGLPEGQRGRGLRAARRPVFERADRARRRPPRPAQGFRAADVPRRAHRGHERPAT